MLYSVLNSKQKQLTGHKSNKMRESTLSLIGNFEEKIDLSHIYLAVQVIFKLSMSSTIVKALLFRNSQMRRRPIFISDSKDTKEWPCFL